jgi:hypothetical protein
VANPAGDKALSPRRFVVWLLTGFSRLALILGSLGIYGLISYSVTERNTKLPSAWRSLFQNAL